MKVFICWSGERSQALAQSLYDWIPLVLHYVEPWMSEADIEAGERWAESIANELETSNFGILCVTKENINSPWILFEAGALAKSLQGSRVIPLLLDLEFRDITGPLAQFQAKKVDKIGLEEVIRSINQNDPNQHPVPEARAKQLFEALWPKFENNLKSIPKDASPAKHTRPQHEILEELVASIRSLDSRFREVSEESPRVRRRRHFHPMMLHDIAHMVGEKSGDPIAILILASMFREDVPWLYELGMEAYKAANSGIPKEAERTLRRFQKASEVMIKGPFREEDFGFDPMMLHIATRELEHLLMRERQKEDDAQGKLRRKKVGKEE